MKTRAVTADDGRDTESPTVGDVIVYHASDVEAQPVAVVTARDNRDRFDTNYIKGWQAGWGWYYVLQPANPLTRWLYGG